MAAKLGRGMRRIVVNGQPFVWRFNQDREGGRDMFRAYAENVRARPFSVLFPDFSSSSGVPYVAGHPEARDINLYTPVWAATFIRHGLASGWQPHEAALSLEGADVLTALDFKPTS